MSAHVIIGAIDVLFREVDPVKQIELFIRLQIKINNEHSIKRPNTFQDGGYPIDAILMPIKNANYYSCFGNENERHEMFFSQNMGKWEF